MQQYGRPGAYFGTQVCHLLRRQLPHFLQQGQQTGEGGWLVGRDQTVVTPAFRAIEHGVDLAVGPLQRPQQGAQRSRFDIDIHQFPARKLVIQRARIHFLAVPRPVDVARQLARRNGEHRQRRAHRARAPRRLAQQRRQLGGRGVDGLFSGGEQARQGLALRHGVGVVAFVVELRLQRRQPVGMLEEQALHQLGGGLAPARIEREQAAQRVERPARGALGHCRAHLRQVEMAQQRVLRGGAGQAGDQADRVLVAFQARIEPLFQPRQGRIAMPVDETGPARRTQAGHLFKESGVGLDRVAGQEGRALRVELQQDEVVVGVGVGRRLPHRRRGGLGSGKSLGQPRRAQSDAIGAGVQGVGFGFAGGHGGGVLRAETRMLRAAQELPTAFEGEPCGNRTQRG